MKTNLLIIVISLIALNTQGQEKAYTSAMKSALEVMGQAVQPDDFLESAMRFERIATAEKMRWMPFYYASHCLVVMSYEESNLEQRDLVLDRAQELLDQALELAPKESELHVMQAFLYPSRIIVDPVGRGMIYFEKISGSLETAKTLNPDNPRIYFLEGVNKANIPSSMGGGAEVARPVLEEAIARFEAFHNDDPLWPMWGKDAARAELEKLQ